MEEKTNKALTCRVKKAVANAVEKAATEHDASAVSDLAHAYAAVLSAEAQANAAGVGTKLLEEINNL